jgi:hypothetical protein
MIHKYKIKNQTSITLTVIIVLTTIFITGCFEEQEEKLYSTLPNGTKIYGDYNKVEISDLNIKTQAGTRNEEIITFGHWFTPENLPNITDEGEYIWAIYNISGLIKNIAGYTINTNFTIKFYNNLNVFLFSDMLYINEIKNSSESEFNFIIDYEQKYFNEINYIEFYVSIE